MMTYFTILSKFSFRYNVIQARVDAHKDKVEAHQDQVEIAMTRASQGVSQGSLRLNAKKDKQSSGTLYDAICTELS
jgi:hypothetical protein